jgi:protoporphyrinogen oxidase
MEDKKPAQSRLSRRDLIKLMGVGAVSIYASSSAELENNFRNIFRLGKSNSTEDFLEKFGPFNRTIGDRAPSEFSGDKPSFAHTVLRDKEAFIESIGGLPAPSETVETVVVGGGMSGLMSAYFLRDEKPVVLEQAERFGGNSQGESWRGLDYSLATSYIGVPEEGSDIQEFFNEIGFGTNYRIHREEDPVFIDGKKYEKIWTNGTNEESKIQFNKIALHFADMVKNQNGLVYPQIPMDENTDRAYIESLDKMTMKEYLEKVVVGGPLHTHVDQVIEHYFWSACAASMTQMSAACAINFFAADFSGIAVAAGGNGAITEALMKKMMETLPPSSLRASSLVFDVRVVDDGCHVTYVDSEMKAKTIKAKYVIMSCPKFAVGYIMDDLEVERRKVINSLTYNGYLVANVLVNQPLKDDFYDLFLFHEEVAQEPDLKSKALKQQATDIVYGSFNKPDDSKSILSIFRGFPYPARRDLLAKDAFAKYQKEFQDQINEEFLPALGISQENVVDIRIARWGHPLPQALAGQIADKKIDALRAPFKDRVFFAEQDNWMLPGFEVCFFEATEASERVKALIAQEVKV